MTRLCNPHVIGIAILSELSSQRPESKKLTNDDKGQTHGNIS